MFVDPRMASVQYTRPALCQERLHRWAMWRITVNQELIHGLEGAQPLPGGHAYHSFMDNYSFTQRYMQNPETEKDHTVYIRSTYGMPPGPKYPMGDTLYFLYGLPRVSAKMRVPDVMSSHHGSMPNLSLFESRENNSAVNRSEPVGQPTTVRAAAIHLQTNSRESSQTRPADTTSRSPTQYNNIYSAQRKTNVEKLNDGDLKPERTSPVNFRDKPETDFTLMHPTNGSEKVNNINKPVLVPPLVFQNEVLRRSNIELPLNINGDHVDASELEGEAFVDPRASRFNERRKTYAWNDRNNEHIGFGSSHKYVDESHLKTHI